MAVVQGLPRDPQVLALRWAGKYFINYREPYATLPPTFASLHMTIPIHLAF